MPALWTRPRLAWTVPTSQRLADSDVKFLYLGAPSQPFMQVICGHPISLHLNSPGEAASGVSFPSSDLVMGKLLGNCFPR